MIPVSEPELGQRELEYVTECLKTGWISSAGRFVEAFEKEWAAYCGMEHGIAVSNGTTALEAACEAALLQPGDEVILPSLTIISCALAIVRCGAIPVLVDCDPRTWCMDVSQVEAKITSRTRAIMPVHIFGHAVDMDPLTALAQKHNLTIIEDAAEAHGAEYLAGHGGENAEWKRCGGLGDISTFSFYGNKNITTGEGGMILCRDAEQARHLRSLRDLCHSPGRRFYHEEMGHNFRLTNMQAAVGLAQVERIDSILEKKRFLGRAYTERLRDLPQLQLPIEEPWARHVYWVYALQLHDDVAMDAVEFARRLKLEGVDTRPVFLGMHEQPVFHKQGLFAGESYPVTEKASRRALYLPSGIPLTESQIDQVSEAVHKVLQ